MPDLGSRWGLIAYADTLDTVGIMATDVDSVERVYSEVSFKCQSVSSQN